MRIDRGLVRRVEHSAADLSIQQAVALATLAPTSGASAEPLDGGALVAFGAGRYVNRAIGVGLGATAADEVVASLGAFYSARGMAPSLEVCPWTGPALLLALGAAGYRLERFRNVYVHDLAEPPREPAVPIAEVGDSTADDRKRILAGDVPADSDARRISDEFCDALALLRGKFDLVALVDGVPAACGSLSVVGGVGWLGGAANLPAHRGTGLQTALVRHRLRLAAAAGCTFAAATALPDGQSARNLERLGFRLAYTQAVLTNTR